jgi:hypothetical protein
MNYLGDAIHLIYKKKSEMLDANGKQVPIDKNYATTDEFLNDVMAQYKLNIKNELTGESPDEKTPEKKVGGRKSRKRSSNIHKLKRNTKRKKRLSYRKNKGGRKRKTNRKYYK